MSEIEIIKINKLKLKCPYIDPPLDLEIHTCSAALVVFYLYTETHRQFSFYSMLENSNRQTCV